MQAPQDVAAHPLSGWLGLDVGGTFTDLVFISSDGVLRWLKTPSTPSEPGLSTLNGIDELVAAGLLGADDLAFLHHVHGTTIATNAIIERKGAKVGVITTDGFRDMLELQRLNVPDPLNFRSQRPQPLAPRSLVREVPGRLNAAGEEIVPLDEDAVRRAVDELAGAGAEEIVICFLHSFTNGAHERRAQEIVREVSDISVHCSSEIWPQAREFERATLALMNAYVRPKIRAYVTQLEKGLLDRKITTEPRSARSNGGIERSATIRERPVVSLLSGPAAGIAGAIRIAQGAGLPNADLITLDVGGTSADIGVIRNGSAVLSTEEQIADFPVLLPTVAVSSIGAGGGSIVWIDEAGVLRVGPRSLGSDPAPACYGKQKEIAGLTDAFLLAGWIGVEEKLGGKISLNRDNAYSAMLPLARRLGCSVEEVADGAIAIATAMMSSETMRVLARRGVDTPDFAMVAFGGAGPLVGALIADETDIKSVLIPPAPGALSAFGASLADVESDFLRPVYARAGDLDPAALRAAVVAVEDEGWAWLSGEAKAIPLTGTSLQWSADMRYDGQGYDVSVEIDRERLVEGDIQALVDRFHEAHRKSYGHASTAREVWIKELRLHVVGVVRKPETIRLAGYGASGVQRKRAIKFAGQTLTADVYPRDLISERQVTGPAIIEQLDCTTFVPPGWSARSAGLGSILLERISS